MALLGPKDQPATYTVRLHFARLGNGDREPVVFDVQLQGKTAVENLTRPIVPSSPAGDAGVSATAIVRVVENVRVTDNQHWRISRNRLHHSGIGSTSE